MKRSHTCGELNKEYAGKEVILNGWVHIIRDLGGIKFILLRDRYGKTQVSFDPNENEELYNKALNLGNEYTVAIKGIVRKRPDEAINPNMKTGEIEIAATELEILSESETPPIYVNKEEETSENLRLKYRYLDLRKDKMQRNLMIRHKFMQASREYLSENGFLEIETPFLTKSTPEGARDFVVPSRIKKGNFYALPQSPQIFKQLLMVSGVDKYFQIARCFRDEDFRADRQPEFTQIDIEQSFADKEDIFKMGEELISKAIKESSGDLVETPFKRMTYQQAMDLYGSDKPDTRYGMQLVDITGYFRETEAKFLKSIIDDGGIIKGFVVEDKANEYSRKKYDELTDLAKQFGASGLIWIANKENDVKSTIKKLASKEINTMIEDGIIPNNCVMLIIAGEKSKANKILGHLRANLIKNEFDKKEGFDILWVTDFPMFSWNEEENRLESEHHPFTMPNLEDLEKYSDSDPLKIKSESYDLVVNGYEMASGSSRIHRKDIQQKVFETIGLDENEIKDKFGFLLEAFRYGPPPHAGVAFGMDRLIAVLAGEDSIKEVIAFPKTATGSDPMSEAPSKLGENQLKDLGINLNM
ncbi:MAG: aspartate--tRNA ligase [Thermotogota bacterium]